MKQLLLVFVGGGTGSIARYLVSKYLNTFSSGLPYGTFAANILGSFLIELSWGWLQKTAHFHTKLYYYLQLVFVAGLPPFLHLLMRIIYFLNLEISFPLRSTP